MSKAKVTAIEVDGPFWFGKIHKIELKSGVKAEIIVPKGCVLRNVYDVAEELCCNIEEAQEVGT